MREGEDLQEANQLFGSQHKYSLSDIFKICNDFLTEKPLFVWRSFFEKSLKWFESTAHGCIPEEIGEKRANLLNSCGSGEYFYLFAEKIFTKDTSFNTAKILDFVLGQ
jgi:hypothetical protein